MKTDFSFIRCITGSKSGSPGCQSSTSFGPSMRINSQLPTCPLPGPCWKVKAGIQKSHQQLLSLRPTFMPTICHQFVLKQNKEHCWDCPCKGSIARESKAGNGLKSQRNYVRKGKRLYSTTGKQLI